VKLLDESSKEYGRDPAAAASVQFVLADTRLRDLKDEKGAYALYGRLAMAQVAGEVDIPGYGKVDIQKTALQIQDLHNQKHWLYKTMAAITRVLGDNPVTGRSLAAHTGMLAILLLSIVIKLVLTPFTKMSYRSMRAMQKLQPKMKELQQRHRDNPQELNRRTMDLYKEHGVNPFGGCLPMLLQLPIIILLWRAISMYQYPLSHESFLWIKSLAVANTPLALLYAISLLASSKLTMMPTADPQQQQSQAMMTYMMPVMFFFLFRTYPAGFILGWLFFNVATTAQQYQLMRQFQAEEDGPASGSGSANPDPGSGSGGGNGGSGGVPRRPSGPGAKPGGKPKAATTSSRTVNKRKKGMAAYHRGR